MTTDNGAVRGDAPRDVPRDAPRDARPPADLTPPRVGRRRGEPRRDSRKVGQARRRAGSSRMPGGPRRETPPSWWHRDHPVFVPLSGFFAGLVLVIVVPGALGAVLSSLFDRDTASHLLPYGLAVFVVPVVLVAMPRTRRFGLYLLLGMVVTAVVVVGVAVATLLLLFSRDS